MIKKMLVCDKCQNRLAELIVPVARNLGKNVVFCEECARSFYDVVVMKLKCETCGEVIFPYDLEMGQKLYSLKGQNTPIFCSTECAISYAEKCAVHQITKNEVKALLEKGDSSDEMANG